MNRMRSRPRMTGSLLSVILLIAVLWFWKAYVSPTKVALVSFPEYRAGQFIKSNKNKWIKLCPIGVTEMKRLKSYDFILVYPYGLTLSETQKQQLIEAGKHGINVFRINRPDGINNLSPKYMDDVSAYLRNQCSLNYGRFLNYVRREIDGKKLFCEPVKDARELSVNSFFYKGEDAVFSDLEAFNNYCKEKSIHHEGAKKVIIFAGMPGPFDTGMDQYKSIIEAFEKKGYNVYPVSGYESREEYFQQIGPDAVVYFPVGRLSTTANLDVSEYLKKQNVPVFCPLGLYSLHDEWLKNNSRMHIVMSGNRIVSPELDGGIVPYAVAAQYRDKDGYVVFRAIPERLEKFVNLVDNYVSLQHEQNIDKKVAILYYKGPGKNAMGGSGIEGIPSLYNVLLKLREEGYNLDGLPEQYADFRDLLNEKGKVFGAYAKGALDDFIQKGYPELIPVDTFTTWAKDILEEEMWQAVIDKYGQPEEGFMVSRTDSLDYIAVSRIQFGNVVIMPIPMAGYGENTFKIIHGTEMPPPHAYLASYFWLQKGFKTDAVIHFGTHGSLEFLHGKPIALSPYDWPDPLIGTMPHFYYYNISVVGEGIIAKRRSYATLLSHLTPPFMESEALKESKLNAKLTKYEHTEGALKEQYAVSVKKLVVEEGIHIDLDLDDDLSKAYSEEEMDQLANYLEEISREKVTGNQYVIGQSYTKEETEQTTRLMRINALSYNLATIDVLKGRIASEDIENNVFFSSHYLDPCNNSILRILNGARPDSEFNKLVGDADFSRAANWRKKHEKQPGTQELMQTMVKMAGKTKSSVAGGGRSRSFGKSSEMQSDRVADQHLKELVVKIAAEPEFKEFFLKLRSNEEFSKVSQLLDPGEKVSQKRMARVIPSLRTTLKMVEDPTIDETLRLMQDPVIREQFYTLLGDKQLKDEIREEKERNDRLLLQQAKSKTYISVLGLTDKQIDPLTYDQMEAYSGYLQFYEAKRKRLELLLKKEDDSLSKQLCDFLNTDLSTVKQKVYQQKERYEQKETAFSDAVFNVRKALFSITETRDQLSASPQSELNAMISALNGGYIAASPGGDPVATPEAVPTGRNMYSVNVWATPTEEAWQVGKKLGNDMLRDYLSKHGSYPKKVSFTLWAGSFIESEGTTIAEIFYLLGVEPVRGNTGSVTDVRLIPAEELKRPRIDVIVQTSGQFRDLGDSRLFLIQKAIEMAALDQAGEDNFVSEGIQMAEKRLIEKGFSPKDAREMASSRIFGGVNNSYGSGIMDMVESSGSWDSTSAVAETYIHNMGSVYGKEENWSDFREGVFEAALLNTEAVVQPRQSNTWGPLSLDHVYEFMGGVNLAIKKVTGKEAESYFNDYRNASHAKVQNLQQAIWGEARSTMLNPRYIKEKMKGEASAAEDFAEVFRNSFGWNVMKPEAIDDQLWDKYYDVYIEDKDGTGIKEFFRDKNPYAYQEMTAVMLESIRKGLWDASKQQLQTLANLHAELVNDYDAGCSGFVCNNANLQHFIEEHVDNNEQREKYSGQIKQVQEVNSNTQSESVVLKKQTKEELFSSFTVSVWWLLVGVGLLLVFLVIYIKKRRN